jgi:DNA-binding response OmpR family regulator
MCAKETAKILVADSDIAHRAQVTEMLIAEGYSVILASNGEKALARIKAGGIDVLVTAISLPGLNGLELIRALRGIDGKLAAVAIAGGMTEIDGLYLKAAEVMGASHGYTRPLTPSVFLNDIRALFERQSDL